MSTIRSHKNLLPSALLRYDLLSSHHMPPASNRYQYFLRNHCRFPAAHIPRHACLRNQVATCRSPAYYSVIPEIKAQIIFVSKWRVR